jgi:hypothetical protein
MRGDPAILPKRAAQAAGQGNREFLNEGDSQRTVNATVVNGRSYWLGVVAIA